MKILKFISFLFFIFLFISALEAKFYADFEGGPLFTGYNNVKIPGNRGTKFSLTESLTTDPWFYFRFQAGVDIKMHNIFLLAAPLSVESKGSVLKPIYFYRGLYPASYPLKAIFTFNSYRLIYYYSFYSKNNLRLSVGLTAKIRDAKISLESLGIKRTRSDFSFVPLVHMRLEFFMDEDLSFLIDADALTLPQVRAEDILVAIKQRCAEHFSIKIGYRLFEGGVDSKSVYTSSLFHYMVIGLIIDF